MNAGIRLSRRNHWKEVQCSSVLDSSLIPDVAGNSYCGLGTFPNHLFLVIVAF